MTASLVDIIIPNYNGLSVLQSCIKSLYKNTEYPFHLVVVDNGSTDGSLEWLISFSSKTSSAYPQAANNKHSISHDNSPLGYAAANNVGLKSCKGKYVLLLNNDTLAIKKGWLKRMVNVMENDSTVGIVGCKLLYPTDLIQHAGVTFGYDPIRNQTAPLHIGRYQPRNHPAFNVERFLPAVTFACALIRRELLADGLDEAYGRGGHEDTDFCMKQLKAGWNIKYVPVELYHYEGYTILGLDKWMEHSSNNYLLWLKRWNDWLIKDIQKRPELYSPNGPVTAFT